MPLRAVVLCLALATAQAADFIVTSAAHAAALLPFKNGNCLAASSTDSSTAGAAATYDYFPDKFVTSAADLFTITYHKTYKVVTQTHDNHKTVLYQCGTPKPDATKLGYTPGAETLFVSVPVSKVAFTSSTFLPLIELLGERDTIKNYASNFAYITSTCAKKLFTDGAITDYAPYPSVTADQNAAIKTAIGDDTPDDDAALNSVTFASAGWEASEGTAAAANKNYREMRLTQSKEDEVVEVAEAIGMVAAVYNREAEATLLFNDIKERYACVKNNVAQAKKTLAQAPTPKVLWFSLAGLDAEGNAGWGVGKCPNYYCEVIADAGGDMIEYADLTPTVTTTAGYGPYYTSEQLLSKAKEAEYVIVTGGYSTATDSNWVKHISTVNQIKAFQGETAAHPRVFDTNGFGSSDWFESRLAEPDVLLEDVVTAIWHSTENTHTPVWVKPVGVAAKTKPACTDVNAVATLQADMCGSMLPNILSITASGAVGYGPSLAHVAAVAVAGLVAMVAM